MRPFFSYYGGKWRIAANYPQPTHDTIVEPFAGSAGYSVRFGTGKRVILCDVDKDICSAWQYLIDATATDILRLPDIGADDSVESIDVCDGAKSLIGYWLNRGTSVPCKRPSAWMRSGKYAGSFWGEAVRRRIANQVHMLRGWEVHNCGYADIRERAGVARATWFVDPPYIGAGKHYRHSAIDYEHLAQWCNELDGQVIVCENLGAEWLPFKSPFSCRTQRRGKRSTEVSYVRNT